MASWSDILTVIQNGVVAVNNLTAQIGILFGLINPRRKLTSATTFFIGDGTGGVGNDANPGTSAALPWLTFAHAMAVLTGQIDFGGQTVTLQAVAGHAAFTSRLNVTPWTGGGKLIFDGGGGSITYTGVDVVDGAILCSNGFIPDFTYQNVTLKTLLGTSQNNSNVMVFTSGVTRIGTGVVFDSSPNSHLTFPIAGGFFFLQNSFTVGTGSAGSGNANSIISTQSSEGGVAGIHININFANNVTIGTLVSNVQSANLNLSGVSWNTGGHTITGQSYFNSNAAFLGGAALIPGTAGTNSGGFLG